MDQRYMNSTLYAAATAGDVNCLSSLNIELKEINVPSGTVPDSEERNETPTTCPDLLYLTPEENNCLHIAARFGHEEFVRKVLIQCPSLVYQQNKKGDNPLHVAARAGHLLIVTQLVDSFKRLQSQRADDQEEEETIIQNEENSTTLPPADCVQPPPTTSDQSQNNIRKDGASISGTSGGDDVTCDRSLTEAEEGERPSHPSWTTEVQQNSTAQTNSSQPHLSSTQIESTGGTVTGTTTSELPSLPIWLTQNHEGSIALHEALRNKHEDIALYLLDQDREQVVLVVNAKNESPLYLAAEAGFVGVSDKILKADWSDGFVGPMDQTPLHAAVFAGSIDCINVLLASSRELTRKKDSYGRTALYYATQANSLDAMRLLLGVDPSSAFISDNERLSPLLVAASLCGQPAVEGILTACPASIESTDDSGHNAVHLAVKHNTLSVLHGLLRMPEMMVLVNQPDIEGNTPLHLATTDHKYGHVKALLSTKCVVLTAKNNLGQTALDLCTLDWELTARQTRIWNLLRGRKASRGRVRPLMRVACHPTIFTSKPMADATNLKQAVNTQSVVASLLATVTFGAVLQLPGGYKAAGDTNVGSPSLIDKPALKVFFIANTISFCCSMMALPPLLVATRSDTDFLRITVRFSQNLIILALYTAMIAFISGLYSVLSIESLWLAILVCALGSSFPFLTEYIASVAHTYTPFVPGLLKGQRARVISTHERDSKLKSPCTQDRGRDLKLKSPCTQDGGRDLKLKSPVARFF